MKNSKKAATFLVLAFAMFGLVGCGLMKKEEPKVEINHKIVGKWSAKFGGDSVVWNFTKDGTLLFSMNGKESPAQKYKMIDDTTVELETKSGTKTTEKLEFSNSDNTMTMTGGIGNLKTTFKRE